MKNDGPRSIDRAWASVLVGGMGSGRDIHRDWFPPLAAGQSGSFDIVTRTENGLAMAAARVRPGPERRRVRVANETDDEAFLVVGDRPRHSDAVSTPRWH